MNPTLVGGEINFHFLCCQREKDTEKKRKEKERKKDGGGHTSYLSRKPREFSCKFFLAGVNVYRFNAKNWRFFTDLM